MRPPPTKQQLNKPTWVGEIILNLFNFNNELANRTLYKQVIILPTTRTTVKIKGSVMTWACLKTACLEKNPPKKRHPLILRRLVQATTKIPKLLVPIWRPCWLWELTKIEYPILMNSIDLKKAWVIKWKKPFWNEKAEIAIISRPSWDKVEKATTFFKSLSFRAHKAPTNIVLLPSNIKTNPPTSNFNKTHNPAVTKVEEWTRADTGVGAAIAAGSHAENGNCADLQIENKTTNKKNTHLNLIINKLKARTKKTSPIRLNSTVFIAPFLAKEER